jgi:hypothetical protein
MLTEEEKYKKLLSQRATAVDSLALYSNSMQVMNFYKNQGYNITPRIIEKDYDLHQENKYALDFERRDTSPVTLSGTRSRGRRDIPRSEFLQMYYKEISPNAYYQREGATTIINPDAPMQRFDRRIRPTMGFAAHGGGDSALVATYNPLSVKPWALLSNEEKKQRITEFGTAGTPFQNARASIRGGEAPQKLQRDEAPQRLQPRIPIPPSSFSRTPISVPQPSYTRPSHSFTPGFVDPRVAASARQSAADGELLTREQLEYRNRVMRRQATPMTF